VNRVFVDSSGFFALRTPDDPFHQHARQLFARANAERWQLLTTNFVVAETYALLLNRLLDGRRKAIEFLDMVSGDKYRIERVRAGDEARAIVLVRTHNDKTYSFCDALSFVVMERLRVKQVIAFDRHFHQYGRFKIL
jgi:predicted nucleic acid-binding protein